jgi:hypothetical protein
MLLDDEPNILPRGGARTQLNNDGPTDRPPETTRNVTTPMWPRLNFGHVAPCFALRDAPAASSLSRQRLLRERVCAWVGS